MTIYEEKHELFKKYCDEMNLYRSAETRISAKDAFNMCEHYISSPGCKWINIFDNRSSMIGFLIIAKTAEEALPHSNYTILHSFILPVYRCNGYMTKTADDYISTHGGIWSYKLPVRAESGFYFWRNFFSKKSDPLQPKLPICYRNGEDKVFFWKTV